VILVTAIELPVALVSMLGLPWPGIEEVVTNCTDVGVMDMPEMFLSLLPGFTVRDHTNSL